MSFPRLTSLRPPLSTTALSELRGLDPLEGGPTPVDMRNLYSKLSVNAEEVEDEWWVESGAETKESLGERLEELLHQAEHCTQLALSSRPGRPGRPSHLLP